MKKSLLTLIILYGLSTFTFAQPIVKLWDKTLGGIENDVYITNVILNSSRQILIACESNSDSGFDKSQNSYQPLYNPIPNPPPNNKYGTWLLSLNASNGQKQWDKVIGGKNQTLPTGFARENSNSFYLTTVIDYRDTTNDLTDPVLYPNLISNYGIWIVNLDSTGNIIWNKRFVADDAILKVNDILIDSGFLYIIGNIVDSISSSQGDINLISCSNISDIFLSKIDLSNQQLVWSKAIGGIGNDKGITIERGWNNSILVGGRTRSPISCNQNVAAWTVTNIDIKDDFFILSIDDMGTVLWEQHYGGLADDALVDIIQTKNGGYLLYGVTNSIAGYDVTQNSVNNVRSCWLIKIDSIGNKIWDKRYGPCYLNFTGDDGSGSQVNSKGRSFITHLCIETSNGDYLFGMSVSGPACGDVTENPRGVLDYWILKTDENGNKLWDKRFGSPNGCSLQSVIELDTNVYISAGFSTTNQSGYDKTEPGRGQTDLWLVCFKDTSLITNTNEISQENIQLNIWPNPTSETLNYSVHQGKIVTQIEVLNMLSEVVMQFKNPSSTTLNISSLQSGSYLLRIQTDKKVYVNKRFMVLR